MLKNSSGVQRVISVSPRGISRRMACFFVRMIIGLLMGKPAKVAAKSSQAPLCWQEITNFTQNASPATLAELSSGTGRVTRWSNDPSSIVGVATRGSCSRSTGRPIARSPESRTVSDWWKYPLIHQILKNSGESN